MKKFVLMIVIFLAASLEGQVATITGITAYVYRANQTQALVTFQIPLHQVLCNLSVVNPRNNVRNPTEIRWQDPLVPSRDCRWRDTSSGPLSTLPLPDGNYQISLSFQSDMASTPQSAKSNQFNLR